MSKTVMGFNLPSLTFIISQEQKGAEHPLRLAFPRSPLSCLIMQIIPCRFHMEQAERLNAIIV